MCKQHWCTSVVLIYRTEKWCVNNTGARVFHYNILKATTLQRKLYQYAMQCMYKSLAVQCKTHKKYNDKLTKHTIINN